MTAKQNAPALRFPEFKGEWELKKVNELGSLEGGGTPTTKEKTYWSGDIPWISSSDIVEDDIHFINVSRFITKEAIQNSATKLIPENSILIVTRVGVGKVAVSKTNLCTSQDFQSLVPFKDNPTFLAYLIQLKAIKMLEFNQGTSIKGITKSDLGDIVTSIPPLPEQQKIAAFLTAVDDKIQQLTRKKGLLEQYKKGVMQQLFSQQLRFKQEDGNDFPDWEENTIDSVTKVTAGATPSTVKDAFWDGDIPWMNSGELNLKRVYKVENSITELGLKNSSTKLIPRFCVLIGLAGQGKTRGTVAMNMFELCTNQSIAAIHPNDEYFLPDFLYYNLDMRYDELRALSTGDGGRGGLNLQIIKALSISFPSINEQQKIASFLSAIDDKINQVSTQLQHIQQYKKGLMQKMFV